MADAYDIDARVREREALDEHCIRTMEKHARCALLPSPEKLNESIGSPGSDKTDTIEDFELVKDWVTNAQLLNAGFYGTIKEQRQQLETCEFGSFIQLAFDNAFAAMRNTASPGLQELVFWYYAGHGLGKEKAETLDYSSTPCLSKVGLVANCNDAANEFVKKLENRKVQGGELCLHEVGFCDLYGLLKPWIAAVKAESINSKGAKKNKHLVIILDSCHSGMIAQELEDFKEQAQEIDQTLLDENSITIQAACGHDERTYGGYFTPCFVYLNDPENHGLLNELKDQWEKMEEQEKKEYSSIDLPSPMVKTTIRPQSGAPSQDVTMELEVQNFKLTLFQDPGFFKFCSMKVYEHQDKNMFGGKDRVLNSNSAEEFMRSRYFVVLDYKLKTYQTPGQHAGTPMGLFLLKDPKDKNMSVCAHIHFPNGNTKIDSVQRINLFHHLKPPMGSASTLHAVDPHQRSSVEVSLTGNGNERRLVKACYDYVHKSQPGRWEDVTKWNMTGKGFNKKFRLQERSAWEDGYLERIKEFHLPKYTAVKTCCV